MIKKKSCLTILLVLAMTLAMSSTGHASEIGEDESQPIEPAVLDPRSVDPTLEKIAELEGWSLDQTADFLKVQEGLMQFADQLRGLDGYLDFRLTEDGRSGELFVEPGVDKSSPFAKMVVPANVEVRSAATTSKEQGRLVAEVEASLGAGFLAATYDVFEDEVIVAVLPSVSDSQRSSFRSKVDPALSESGASVRLREARELQPAYGGQRAYGPDFACTTGFGVKREVPGQPTRWGYITSAHCGAGSYNINGNVFYNWFDYSLGGYRDRIFVEAGGSTWLTQINSYTTVDMQATAGHIYSNSYVCHYGKSSNALRCGTIYSQNEPLYFGGQTIWTSLTPANCQQGDSGGPVWSWSNQVYYPRGMVEGAVDGNGDCAYLAIDDQLSSSNLVLR